MGPSTQPDSPTFILDMTTGQPVAHFAEIDMQADATPDSQALFLRPAARLVGGHRYAVAITNRVKARDGGDLADPARLRGAASTGKPHRSPAARGECARGSPTCSPRSTTPASPTDDLVVAWDFTVASDDYIHRDMTAARDRAIAALAESSRRRSRSPPTRRSTTAR